ncbi:MAG: hypothetical protein ACRD11_06025 [Terriglobia bacterium]
MEKGVLVIARMSHPQRVIQDDPENNGSSFDLLRDRLEYLIDVRRQGSEPAWTPERLVQLQYSTTHVADEYKSDYRK